METLSFGEWFKIIATMLGFFIGYTKWVVSSQEKMKNEWRLEKKELVTLLRNKIDTDVYNIQITQINKQLDTLEEKMDKLTDMLQKLSVDMATHIREEKLARQQ